MSTGGSRNSALKRRHKARLFGGRPTAKCCFCRRDLTPATATIEHVVPLSAGGRWARENLALSCSGCNHARGCEDFVVFLRRVRGQPGVRA